MKIENRDLQEAGATFASCCQVLSCTQEAGATFAFCSQGPALCLFPGLLLQLSLRLNVLSLLCLVNITGWFTVCDQMIEMVQFPIQDS